MQKKSKIYALAAAILLIAGSASASTIRVSQESADGAGDFDANVLGTISSFSTTDTIADFYSYGTPAGSSYNGTNPAAVSGATQYFFVNASDGLAFVAVHDAVNSGGGTAISTYAFSGGTAAGTAYAVKDDGGGTGTQDQYGNAVDAGGDRSFTTNHRWLNCCTDGVAFNNLGSDFSIIADLNQYSGFNTLFAADGNNNSISLNLGAGRAVRFDMVAPVPVPAAGFLLLAGVGALGAMRARRKPTS